VVAHDGDGLVFVELVEGARAYLIHGHEDAVGDMCGGVLPGLADVEQKRWVLGGELLFELVDGDLKVHGFKDNGWDVSGECCQGLARRNSSGLTIGGVGRRIAGLSASHKKFD
jgi:hypothetical protein